MDKTAPPLRERIKQFKLSEAPHKRIMPGGDPEGQPFTKRRGEHLMKEYST
jgi:hypothetical protein